MTVNIPWETNCGVIAGTIKWTKAMQLRPRKSKTGRIGKTDIFPLNIVLGFLIFARLLRKL